MYDVVGDDVNIAARVESAGTVMKVTITPTTRHLLGSTFETKSEGIAQLKGKGDLELFTVSG